jgi:hypothetical protein
MKSMIMNIVDFICFVRKFIWRKISKKIRSMLIISSKIVH